jgi:DNA-binding transcriptional MocR family regulator
MPVNSFAEHPLSWTPPQGVPKTGPVYLAIAAALEEAILSGSLPGGTKLPPQRELADFLDIDFTTVTRAYNLCREKGLVYGVTGRGTFVSSPDSPAASDETVDCAVVQAFPEAGCAQIAEAARDILSRPSSENLFSYRNRDGSPSSLVAARRWLELCGAVAPSFEAAVFPGAQGAISSVLLSLFRPGESIAVDEFTYSNFISLARLAHLNLVPVPADNSGMIPSALRKAAAKPGLKGVFVMPCGANPTGLTLCEKRKDELAGCIREKNLLLVEDDARMSLPRKDERTLFARIPENTVYISGSTRNMAPGLRATFMAFPGRFAESILGALHHLTIKAGALDAEILAELVLSGKAEKILAAKAKKARAANKVFGKTFPSAPVSPETSLFRMLPFPGTSGRGREIEAFFRSAGVGVCHSDRFCVRKGHHDSFLRISLSSTRSIDELKKGLKLIDAAMRSFPG